MKIILGGPEVSYESEGQDICKFADLTIQGEGDFKFYEVCRDFLTSGIWPARKWIAAELPAIQQIELPYRYYTDHDIRNRVIYVEASRGCPYKCEYCLSSLDKSVRAFDLQKFLAEMDELIRRGARTFKFLDRTFNLSISTSSGILRFFLDRISLGLFLHFEVVPDRLPIELRELIQRFPKGSLQFEIGIQTWNPEVAKLVSRRQDYAKIRENLSFLSKIRIVHTHVDLIAGLPGEDKESFANGFDTVAELEPDEIQVGLLKRLKGTPIVRHDQQWKMIYQEHPPFQILQTATMSFEDLQRIARFSQFWDLIANSGNFKGTLSFLKELSRSRAQPSLYREIDELAVFLNERHPQSHGVALINLLESVWIYLKDHRHADPDDVRELLIKDYTGPVRRDIPRFLKPQPEQPSNGAEKVKWATPARQRRHLGGATVVER